MGTGVGFGIGPKRYDAAIPLLKIRGISHVPKHLMENSGGNRVPRGLEI